MPVSTSGHQESLTSEKIFLRLKVAEGVRAIAGGTDDHPHRTLEPSARLHAIHLAGLLGNANRPLQRRLIGGHIGFWNTLEVGHQAVCAGEVTLSVGRQEKDHTMQPINAITEITGLNA